MKYKYLASFGFPTKDNILRWYDYMLAKGHDESGEIIDKLALNRQVTEMIQKLEEEHGKEKG